MKKLFSSGLYSNSSGKGDINKYEYLQEKSRPPTRPINKSYLEYEAISTAKIERQMRKYIADTEEGRRRLAAAKLSSLATSRFIAKALAPSRNLNPTERLRKFTTDLEKRGQRVPINKRTPDLKIDEEPSARPESPNVAGQESMETIYDPFQPTRGLGYRSRPSSLWNVDLDRAMELKSLLEERERYYNGEMDDIYYKVGPAGNSIPAPANLAIKTSTSATSSRLGTSVFRGVESPSQLFSDPDHQKFENRKRERTDFVDKGSDGDTAEGIFSKSGARSSGIF